MLCRYYIATILIKRGLMHQRLKGYILLIATIFIVAYIISEYYLKGVDREVNLYKQQVNALYNTHEVLFHVTAIQKGLYSLQHGTSKDHEPMKRHFRDLEQGIESLSVAVSYIYYSGRSDDLFKTYSHHVEVIDTIYYKFIEKVKIALAAKEGPERELYLRDAIESGEGLEALVAELEKFTENDHEQVAESITATTGRIRRIRNIVGIMVFIAIGISSIIMFCLYRPCRKMLPFLKAIKEGDYDYKVNTDNEGCCGEIVSTFNMIRDRIKKDEETSESLIITDPLTGIYNRRYFDIRIDEEMNRCIRYGTIFSLSLIDIDHFKEVNDTYGHQVGDSVLKEVVMLIRNNSRETDIVARYGGEEFAIIYPCTPKSGVLSHIERLREAVEEHKFRDLNRSVTISIGAADSTAKREPHQVIEEADSSLYMAKSKGRNRCVIVGVAT